MFAILPASQYGEDPKLTFGGYQHDDLPIEKHHFYNSGLNNLTSHRIAGSFHWELPVVEMSVNGSKFKTSTADSLFDTGCTMLLLYKTDYVNLINKVCA